MLRTEARRGVIARFLPVSGGRRRQASSSWPEHITPCMKVAVLSSVHNAFDVRIFQKECKSVAGAGYEVTLIVPHGRDEVVDGVQIKAVPRASGRLSRMTRTVWKVYREAWRQAADIYHFHDPELISVGLLLRARGKKIIYDIHEDVPEDILGKYYLPRWIRRPVSWVAKWIEGVACRHFSGLIAATPHIANRLGSVNPRTKIVQNFPITEELASDHQVSWNQRSCSVAFVGGISVDRGPFEIVRAMTMLPPALPVTLKLAGDFSPLSLRDELARLPGWGKVEVLGFVGRAELARVLNSVRAGLVLLYPEARHKAGYPVKMFEYMSVGIPVIASDFPLWRAIIEGNGCGLLVDPLNPQAIAEAIGYIMTHPQEAEAMGLRGREAVEKNYNWATEEKKLLALYEEVLTNA